MWSALMFVVGLLIPDPWTLIRIVRYRRLDWDALIGVKRFQDDVLVYAKRRFAPEGAQLMLLRSGKFVVRRRKR